MPTSSANDAIMQGGMPEPNSTLPLAATTEGMVAMDLMPAPQGRVCRQHQVSKSPSHKIEKARLDDSNSSRATLFLIGDSSASLRSPTQLPSTRPNSPPCLGRQQLRLGHVHSPGTPIRWPAPNGLRVATSSPYVHSQHLRVPTSKR